MPECKSDKDPCDILPVAGEAWSVCLPFGGRVWADGAGVHAAGGIAPPDGVYGKVVIADGCIVGVEPEDVPLYTGSPCAPLPTPCEGESVLGPGFSPGETTIVCEIEAGSGVSVTGDGTADNPYVISAETGVHLRSANAAISLSGNGTRQSPYTITHKPGLATTVNGMTFDAFGHLSSVGSSSANKGIQGIVPGFGVKADVDSSGIATLSLQPQADSVQGKYQLGAFDIALDKAGRVSSVSQAVSIQGAPLTAACGAVDLMVNQLGLITSVADTMRLGAGYLLSWDASATAIAGQFDMRCASALAGVCYSKAALSATAVIKIDGQVCNRVDKLFWGGGVFMAGLHTLEITGASGETAVLLVAVS